MVTSGRERARASAAYALVGLALAASGALWATGPALTEESWTPRFLRWYAVAWVCYAVGAMVASRARRLPRWVLLWIVVAALGMRIVCLARTPLLSTDVWRYLWDGRVINAGINPYRYPPRAARQPRAPEKQEPSADVKTLRGLRDENWRHINWKQIPTIYPPLAQLLFAGLARVRDGDAEAFRWAFTLFDMASILVLIGLLRRTNRRAERVVWYAWCPLTVTECAAGAHVDAFALFPLLLALLLVARRGERPRPASGISGIALAAAVMAKGYALPAMPLFVRRGGWKLLLAFLVTLAVLVAPFASVRGHMFDGLNEYVDRWGANASLFTVLDRLLAGSTPEHFQIARRISMAAVGLVALALAWRFKSGTERLLAGTFAAIGAQLLIGAPTLPWYVIWVVPALCWWEIPALALFTLTVSEQYYARNLWQGDEAKQYALLWAGYVPVHALLIGQVIVWGIRRRRSARA